jgi:hypothetical protein
LSPLSRKRTDMLKEVDTIDGTLAKSGAGFSSLRASRPLRERVYSFCWFSLDPGLPARCRRKDARNSFTIHQRKSSS